MSAKFQLQMFITNPIFLSAIFSWLSAQFIKTLIRLVSGRVHSLSELISLLLWKTGGMPSSHSALVSAITTAIGYRSGINSEIFLLSCCFALVTVRDAVGVRRSSGIQAKVINTIGTELKKKEVIDSFNPVKEVQGHKPLEVIVGCLLGVFIGTAFSIL
ncbi:MAG: divergent PAP2 family protein [Spirochaetaceae bacterium]|nr:divergent PAP2 family protein [Spirochaetaceae bacterium]